VTVESTLFAYSMGALFIAMILFVIFGQTTMRKLRKNPKTKDELGMEFASGWDIFNVAGALALPRWLNSKLRNSPLASLYANAELLDENTNIYDRTLATLFYILFTFSITTLMMLMILDQFDVFD